MKYVLFLLVVAFGLSCNKEKLDPEIPAGGLYEIQSNGNIHNKVEYHQGKVARLSAYTVCGKAFSELNFRYQGNQVTAIRVGNRPFLPSWGEDCNTEKPFEYADYQIEYDAQGHYTKVFGDSYQAIYEYNGQQATARIRNDKDGPMWTRYLKFDDRGNLIEVRQSETENVGLTRYEYDNNPNPLHGLSAINRPDPFYSPNNLLRALEANGEVKWSRAYTYNSVGQPLTCVESTGASYQYLYR